MSGFLQRRSKVRCRRSGLLSVQRFLRSPIPSHAASLRTVGQVAEREGPIMRELRRHENEDERRFDVLGLELARIKGMLAVLLAVVVGSGLLNYLAHSG